MITIRQAVIVEGKYDQITLRSLIDAPIIPVGGFSVFKDREMQAMLRALAERVGLVILTDSDVAGFKIRAKIAGLVPPERVIHAYIPDIAGKERRKSAPSKEGTLGVEGMTPEVLIRALENAGVITAPRDPELRRIGKADFYRDGLSGTDGSATKRRRLIEALGLPRHLSANALLTVLNAMMSYEEYLGAVASLLAEEALPS